MAPKKHLIFALAICIVLGGIIFQAQAVEGESENRLAVAGKLELDYHAEFMVTRDDSGTALNWNNCGLLLGGFGDFGFDGPRDLYPKFEKDLSGSPAVVFSGKNRFRQGPDPAPESICDASFSLELWAQNADGKDGKMIAWGGLTVTPADFSVGNDKAWHHLALIAKDGAADYYLDGTKVKSGPLPKMSPDKMIVGENFSGAIAAIPSITRR